MCKKAIVFLIIFNLAIAWSYAAEEGPARKFIDKSMDITQGDYAVMLVNSMGVEAQLPTAPIAADYVRVLDKMGVRPLGGWVPSRMLTNGDFAVTLARAMGIVEAAISAIEIKEDAGREADPAAKYIIALKQRGIELDGPPSKILSYGAVKRALTSPVFRAFPMVVANVPLEAEQYVTPVTTGGS